jgi:hypothetical protein
MNRHTFRTSAPKQRMAQLTVPQIQSSVINRDLPWATIHADCWLKFELLEAKVLDTAWSMCRVAVGKGDNGQFVLKTELLMLKRMQYPRGKSLVSIWKDQACQTVERRRESFHPMLTFFESIKHRSFRIRVLFRGEFP